MEDSLMKIKLTVNGIQHLLTVEPHTTLLDLLRVQLHLTGTKRSCGEGECGACTVLLNGRAVNSCIVFAAEEDGSEVVTIEGLAEDGRPNTLQKAFLDHGAVQCGFCTPGMIIAATHLLMINPNPSVDEIKEALAGNLCRCTGYEKIIQAVHSVAAETATEGKE
jgi:aerobic carbon-monoxide dehydrogenase small subunit